MTIEAVSVATDASASRTLYSKVMWHILPLLLACYIGAYLDRVNVGFAKLQMLKDLGLSETVYGLGAGMFFVGYVIFEIPSNMLMMRVGPRAWIGRIMITWGIISALTLVTTSANVFYALRFLLGAAEAGFIPAIIYYLMIWFPSSQRGKASALFLAGIPLSGVIGGPLSGWLMSALDGKAGLAGWQWMFLVEGLPAVILGILCFVHLDNSVDAARWLTPAEKDRIRSDVLSESRDKPLVSARDGLLDPRVWILSFTYFFFTMGLYGVSFWLPSIIKDSGVRDPLSVGLLTAIPYIGAFMTMILVSWSSDRHRERRWHLALPALFGAAGLVASVLFSQNTVIALAALTVASSGILTCVPQFYVLPPAILTGAAAAIGLAVANSVGSVAGFISPYLLGYVKDLTGSTNAGVLVLSVALVIGAAMVFVTPARMVNR